MAEGIERFPADHYVLIMNDHGASWPGIGADESAGHTTMSLEGIAQGITDGLAAAGVEKLDLLGFDACLMATYEVASTVAPLADRMVARSELEPGHGWDYTSLSVLADDPDATADDLGTALVDSFLAEDDSDATLALLDLTQRSTRRWPSSPRPWWNGPTWSHRRWGGPWRRTPATASRPIPPRTPS